MLSPSLLSAVSVIVLAAGFIGQKGWAHIHHKQLFYDILFGNYGVQTRLLAHQDNSSRLRDLFLNDNTMYLLLLVLCAIAVGCLVYLLIRGLTGVASGSREVLTELRSQDRTAKAMLVAFVARLGVRTAGLIGWVVYTVLFIGVLSPLCISLLQVGIDQLSASGGTAGWIRIAGSGILFAVFLHIHVTFMRICFLRLRLFGGDDSDLYVSEH
jgi:hypothetical protein